MSRKIWLIIIGALVIIVGFFVFILLIPEEEEGNWVEIAPKFEEPQYYEIKETDKGTLLVNEHAGFSLEVPEGWRVEKLETSTGQWIVNLLSPDAVLENSLLKAGCGASVWVEYGEKKYIDILNKIQSPSSVWPHIKYSTTTISGTLSLKKESEGKLGKILIIEAPFTSERIFHIGTFILADYSQCEDFYNQIVNSINFLNI